MVFALAMLVVAVVALAAACGGGDDDDGGNATPSATQGGNGSGKDVTFDVSMGDNMFDPEGFTVAPGAEVTFNLTNDGVAVHNMHIADKDGKYSSDDGVSDPDLVNAGDTATLEWTAPDAPGEIKFQCDIHPTDMRGVITVK